MNELPPGVTLRSPPSVQVPPLQGFPRSVLLFLVALRGMDRVHLCSDGALAVGFPSCTRDRMLSKIPLVMRGGYLVSLSRSAGKPSETLIFRVGSAVMICGRRAGIDGMEARVCYRLRQ